MIRVFIGYDSKEPIAYHVLSHSILRRATQPVSITPLALNQIRQVFSRDREALQSTEFSFSRFLVPYLCGFEGAAIFMDSDMLCLSDISKLWARFDPRYAVQVVKHEYEPERLSKFLGQTQSRYQKKNWSSVMMFNNEKCRTLDASYVNEASGLELHQFKWLGMNGDFKIGDLPENWNYLVGHTDPSKVTPHLVHFTEGGPWFEPFKHVDFANLWRQELKMVMYAAS